MNACLETTMPSDCLLFELALQITTQIQDYFEFLSLPCPEVLREKLFPHIIDFDDSNLSLTGLIFCFYDFIRAERRNGFNVEWSTLWGGRLVLHGKTSQEQALRRKWIWINILDSPVQGIAPHFVPLCDSS